ncbi:MAG: hypothetical protein HY904_15675 [Deltaproteobacteria bacterium]|nr:hypothetical protein [Deltaproteobacteria bacterium]
MQTRVVHRDDGLALVVMRRVLIATWQSDATEERIGRLGDTLRDLVASAPNGVGLLVIRTAPGRSPTLEPGPRTRLEKVMQDVSGSLVATSYALTGSGMWIAPARSDIRALQDSAGGRRSYAIFDTVQSAAEFLVPKLAQAAVMTSAVEMVTAAGLAWSPTAVTPVASSSAGGSQHVGVPGQPRRPGT